MFFKLDENKNAVPCSAQEWCDLIEKRSFDILRRVTYDVINGKRVSTVFLGTPHGLTNKGLPLLFETMVFEKNSSCDIYMDRYCTWKEAEEGHKRAIEWVKEGCKR